MAKPRSVPKKDVLDGVLENIGAGVVRLGLNADYDRIHNLANYHLAIREMLGHGGWAENTDQPYHLQTIKDNLSLFTPAILDRINQEVVQAGHVLLKKDPRNGSPDVVIISS